MSRGPGANRDELSPLALLRRSATAYPGRVAVRDGDRSVTFGELTERAWRLGDALRGLGVETEERVAMLSLNRLELLEAHFGVPAARGALCAVNTRLAAPEIRLIVERSGARVLLLDPELEAAGSQAAALPGMRVVRLGEAYEAMLAAASLEPPEWPDDEDRPISVNYTSGTTGAPKGVVYTHRGAYLGALADLVETRLGPTAPISGRCPCSTATAGASAGASRASAPRAWRCDDPTPKPCGGSCARERRTSAPRRRC